MEALVEKSLLYRLSSFTVILGCTLLFVYGFLPFLTNSFPILSRMSSYLDDNGIDPSRYYYTDVEQVKEAELYLETVLDTKDTKSYRPSP
jgi:hypothetical protein